MSVDVFDGFSVSGMMRKDDMETGPLITRGDRSLVTVNIHHCGSVTGNGASGIRCRQQNAHKVKGET